MSPSHRRATAHNFAEFAQNLEMFTPKLEKSCDFTIFTYVFLFFLHLLCDFFGIAHYLAQNIRKYSFDSARKNTFRMSVHLIWITSAEIYLSSYSARPSHGIDVSVCLSVCVFVSVCLYAPPPLPTHPQTLTLP